MFGHLVLFGVRESHLIPRMNSKCSEYESEEAYHTALSNCVPEFCGGLFLTIFVINMILGGACFIVKFSCLFFVILLLKCCRHFEVTLFCFKNFL